LNGGFAAWRVDERSLVLDIPQITPSNITLSNADGNRLADANWVNDHRGDSGVVVLDARTPEDYQGIEGGGHIEGAVNVTVDLAYSNGTIRNPREIVDLFDDHGLDSASTVVVYNTDGTLGSRDYYALRVAGKNVRLYLGGWAEWSSQGLPTATGVE
jgi:thiosulfate/3-mercaptopyruvate sulfurtransferase